MSEAASAAGGADRRLLQELRSREEELDNTRGALRCVAAAFGLAFSAEWQVRRAAARESRRARQEEVERLREQLQRRDAEVGQHQTRSRTLEAELDNARKRMELKEHELKHLKVAAGGAGAGSADASGLVATVEARDKEILALKRELALQVRFSDCGQGAAGMKIPSSSYAYTRPYTPLTPALTPLLHPPLHPSYTRPYTPLTPLLHPPLHPPLHPSYNPPYTSRCRPRMSAGSSRSWCPLGTDWPRSSRRPSSGRSSCRSCRASWTRWRGRRGRSVGPRRPSPSRCAGRAPEPVCPRAPVPHSLLPRFHR